MAYREKIGNNYCVRYKDVTGAWIRKSCGKNATRAEADYIVKEYSARELKIIITDRITNFHNCYFMWMILCFSV